MSLGKRYYHDLMVLPQDPEYFLSEDEDSDYQRQELEALNRRREEKEKLTGS